MSTLEAGKLHELLAGIQDILATPHAAMVLDKNTLDRLTEMKAFITDWLQGSLPQGKEEKLQLLTRYTLTLAESVQQLDPYPRDSKGSSTLH